MHNIKGVISNESVVSRNESAVIRNESVVTVATVFIINHRHEISNLISSSIVINNEIRGFHLNRHLLSSSRGV